ncbi:HlyD family secretion protein [Limoniibacter endophyticus]|uniref:Membrane protein n=1 Tax=Limoniibacter endophyticus TaxID=1565040 RepID=A0A8J3DQ26_9HYPH|nr:HlyD family secretion protein [Limoniibacter endophyticus]GHC65400.1 membrane protein [Limoniibacter endophyticus]
MNAISKIEEDQAVNAPAKKRGKGRKALFMLALPLVLAVGGGYVWVTGGRFQETENANLKQVRINVAAEIGGRVVEVAVQDGQEVRKGDLLFAVDAEPYRIALAEAEASLASARLSVEQLRAAYGQAKAQLASAQSDLTFARAQSERENSLLARGVSTHSSADQATRDLARATQAVSVAQQALDGAAAALGGNPDSPVDQHPSVLAAKAALDKAQYQLDHTVVHASADGIVYQASSFREGQFVNAGTSTFALVETQHSWIDANFKETQLTHMQVGQPAELELDVYPGRKLEAEVTSIGAGTGAEFSLLPAQNATGNWVKVTQRIPVRVELKDPDEAIILRTGMSATVTVDTGVARGFKSLFNWF